MNAFTPHINHAQWTAYRETLLYVQKLVDCVVSSSGAAVATVEPLPSSLLIHWLGLASVIVSHEDQQSGAERGSLQRPEIESNIKAGKSSSAPLQNGGNSGRTLSLGQYLFVDPNPLQQMQNRCQRWTTILAFWMEKRIEAMEREAASVDALKTASSNVDESLRYLHLFIPSAYPFIEKGSCQSLEAKLNGMVGTWKGTEIDHRGDVVATGMAHYKEMTKGSCTETLPGDICVASATAVELVAHDYLHVTWDYIHPSTIPSSVSRRLQRSATPREATSEFNPLRITTAAIPTRFMMPLLEVLRRRRRQLVAAPPGTGLSEIEKRWIENALLAVGYNLITKMEAGLIEQVYYTIPALLDFEECARALFRGIPPMESALPSSRVPSLAGDGNVSNELPPFYLLQMVKGGFRSATTIVFQRRIHSLLEGYNKRKDNRKGILVFSIPQESDTGTETKGGLQIISATAYRILADVVEPTLQVLEGFINDEATVIPPPQATTLQSSNELSFNGGVIHAEVVGGDNTVEWMKSKLRRIIMKEYKLLKRRLNPGTELFKQVQTDDAAIASYLDGNRNL